jgi:hypothetical protein
MKPVRFPPGRGKLELAHLLRRHANASIGDGDGDTITTVFLSMARIDGNRSALRKLVGIAHEIEQRLPEPHRIRMQRSDRAIAVDH